MRIPAGTRLMLLEPMELPRYSIIPEPEMPFPSASGAVLAPVPQTFPGSSTTYESFLYSQLQNSVQPGSPNTYTAQQTYQMAADTAALILTTSGAGSQSKRVKTNLNGLWEVGTNSLYDGIDLDYYWKDLTNNAVRMRLDTDNQLSLLGYANSRNTVNQELNLESRPTGSLGSQVGFGVGILFRLADANAGVNGAGAFNCVLDTVTAGATDSHFDLYCNAAGASNHIAKWGATNLAILATDTNTASITTMLTLKRFSGASQAGTGQAINWTGFDGANNFVTFGQQAMFVTNPTAGAVDTAWGLTVKKGGVECEVLRIQGSFGPISAPGPGISGNAVGGRLYCFGDFAHAGTALGFFSTTPVAKPAVTGSRGSNAALASLLTQLAALGLLTDSTS